MRAVTAALSDVAEALLGEVAARAEAAMRERFGDAGPYALLALGKLGGREMSYHSDLDLVLVYAQEGRSTGPKPLDHYEYFTEYARRLIKALSHHGPLGRLYAVDMRLAADRPERQPGRPAGRVPPLFRRRRRRQVWERQSLTRARPVHGDADFASEAMAAVRAAAFGPPWGPEVVAEIRSMRDRLEASAPPRSLKRGTGRYDRCRVPDSSLPAAARRGRRRRSVVTNTWEALEALREAGLLQMTDHEILADRLLIPSAGRGPASDRDQPTVE